jgi:hypothetical protein
MRTEYRFLTVDLSHIGNGTLDRSTEVLNELAGEGWRPAMTIPVCSPTHSASPLLLLERRLLGDGTPWGNFQADPDSAEGEPPTRVNPGVSVTVSGSAF